MFGQKNWSVKSIAEILLEHNPYSNLNIKGGLEAMKIYHHGHTINFARSQSFVLRLSQIKLLVLNSPTTVNSSLVLHYQTYT